MSKEKDTLVFNEEITLTGTYKECILSKRKEATHKGLYKIVINDTLEVVLLPPYLDEAKRAAEEVSKFQDKLVTVTGVVEEETYMEEPSLDYDVLTVNIPCFASIKSIKLAQ